ncbi:MAG TPA: WecB/TagA/CpsF family glycosyltransferase [Rhodopila sp.]|uniref:WecB/TagA/CpsF family glycosyltransferase n=1 Tax=Rhodopila sp. TaxID=2480087 RepID=UPI002B6DD1DF|nr:WecB/TagA/CpsF family glycosyltransferase [Rhodopila sp.]HVY14999.1 WecB/TagA/CpsF family glycosyltransferase [Rhodopila sp.]
MRQTYRNQVEARPFGLKFSPESARDIALTALNDERIEQEGVALVVTPNIDHIATIRRSASLAQAYRNATRIVCDGWPVQAYARFRGLRLDRVTGCEITSELMRMVPYTWRHRMFFVVDSQETERALAAWARENKVEIRTEVPPYGFERHPGYCVELAGKIALFNTTILVMAVGAPRSEIFVDTHRVLLPPCWAFCVGQAVKIELGLVRRASPGWQAVGMEWLWRLRQEPSRLAKRYVTAAFGFSLAAFEDWMRSPPRWSR